MTFYSPVAFSLSMVTFAYCGPWTLALQSEFIDSEEFAEWPQGGPCHKIVLLPKASSVTCMKYQGTAHSLPSICQEQPLDFDWAGALPLILLHVCSAKARWDTMTMFVCDVSMPFACHARAEWRSTVGYVFGTANTHDFSHSLGHFEPGGAVILCISLQFCIAFPSRKLACKCFDH